MKLWRSSWLWLVLSLAVFLCLPLSELFWFYSHESDAYVLRTVEYANALANGELYPRWLPHLYGDYGSPFANFYAPGVMWIGGVLSLLVGSPVLALKLVIVLCALVAAASTFALVYQECARDEVAFLAACLYTAAPYRVAELSWRGDLAELLALSMLPTALFAYRRITKVTDAQLPMAALLAALAHAGLVMSHTLMGLWGTGLVAVMVIIALRTEQRRRSAILVATFVSSLLISSVYTLPAMLEKQFVRTDLMTAAGLASENNGLAATKLFSQGAHQTGPLLLGALLVFAFAHWRRRQLARAALPWLLGACALTFLTLKLASPLWAARLIPFGEYMQFPWRLLGPASLLASVAIALALAHALPAPRVAALVSLPLVVFAVMLAVRQTDLLPMRAESVVLSTARLSSTWNGGTALVEYLPQVVSFPAGRPADGLATSNPDITVQVENSSGTRHTLVLDVVHAGDLMLALHGFPGWAVTTLEGPQPLKLDTSAIGLVSLHAPAPGRYRALVYFGSTPVRRTADALGLLGLLAIWPAAWLLSRPRTRGSLRTRTIAGRPTLGNAA